VIDSAPPIPDGAAARGGARAGRSAAASAGGGSPELWPQVETQPSADAELSGQVTTDSQTELAQSHLSRETGHSEQEIADELDALPSPDAD